VGSCKDDKSYKRINYVIIQNKGLVWIYPENNWLKKAGE
jgi:hypothetical protein